MKNNKDNYNKQSRRENKDTYVVNPQKSADPPQPQGKSNNNQSSKANNIEN
ncbi:MAG: hypothetical protein IJW86_02440 [Clostridia bacterium]|nr:hypothetical protein [Clostridia bacterium]